MYFRIMEQPPKDHRPFKQVDSSEPSKTYKAITVLSGTFFVAALSCCCCVLPLYKGVEQIISAKKVDAKDLFQEKKDVREK